MMISAEDQALIKSQLALTRSLSVGIALSLFPIAGVGSSIALIVGIRGWIKIERSQGKLVGIGMAIWCIVVGAIGLTLNLIGSWPLITYGLY